MKLYHVTLRVTSTRLAELLSVVAPSCDLVSVIEAPTTEGQAQPRRTGGYVGGIKNKGITSEDLVLATINQEPKRTWTGEELANVFVERGFAGNSYSAACTKLIQAGKIRRVGQGLFAPLGLSIHKGTSA